MGSEKRAAPHSGFLTSAWQNASLPSQAADGRGRKKLHFYRPPYISPDSQNKLIITYDVL